MLFNLKIFISILCSIFSTAIFAQTTLQTLYPVGMKQMEFVTKDHRTLNFALFYPAKISADAKPMRTPLFIHLQLYKDATPLTDNVKRPLVIFSHGRGSSAPYYAWFAEYLAARGYIVAAVYHYRANTYDATIPYWSNKLWQRPVDISLDITYLLKDKFWGQHIDANRIGVAGHSQGGFTALWIGGATVNPQEYLNFQRLWINNAFVPPYLHKELPLDAKPAMHVHDPRVKAVFAMAPGVFADFGMDAAGLKKLKIPTYLIVGAIDTQASPKENVEFAAKYIPHVQAEIMPGRVDHEIFVNECDQIGKDAFPEACVDAPSVNRAKMHEHIGETAFKFFETNMPSIKINP